MEKILTLINELNISLSEDPRIIACQEAEKKMEANREVILLIRKKEEMENRYSDLLKIYSDNDEIVKKVQKELYHAKKALDENVLVRDYIKKYQIARDLVQRINQTIFADIIFTRCK